MPNFTVENSTIKTEKFIYTFDYEIDEIQNVDDILIVLLKIPKGSKEVDNLYGLSLSGQLLWRVQSVQEAYSIPHNTPYVALAITSEKKIRVTNFYGIRYTVNPKNGTLTDKESIG